MKNSFLKHAAFAVLVIVIGHGFVSAFSPHSKMTGVAENAFNNSERKPVIVQVVDPTIDTALHVVDEDLVLGTKILKHVGDTAIATFRVYATGAWKVIDVQPCVACATHPTTIVEGVKFDQTITTNVIRKK